MAGSAAKFLLLILAVAVAFGGIFVWGYAQYVRPGPLERPVTAIVPPGTSVDGIARVLADAGILADPKIFRFGVRLSGDHAGLRAGEYGFPAGVSQREVAAILRSGKTVVRRLTVAEGLSVAQVAGLVQSTDGLMGDLGPLPAEGELLPETYHFSHGERRSAMIGRMRDAMDRTLAKLWAERAPDLPLRTQRDALILASIVEKETGVPEERAKIARVFLNRLAQGMRLQSDPTVVYGLTQGSGPLDRALSGADLKTPSPFNTYLNAGLPPAPICNPGLAAIEATLHPAETDALYFVADGSGGHAFARTLAEHNRNVARWRQLRNGRPEPGRAEPAAIP